MAPSGSSTMPSASAAMATLGTSVSSGPSTIPALLEHDYLGLADAAAAAAAAALASSPSSSSSSLHRRQPRRQDLALASVGDEDLRLGLGPPVPRTGGMAEGCGLKRGYAEAMADARLPRLQGFEDLPGPSPGDGKLPLHVGWAAAKPQQPGCLATYLPLRIGSALMGIQQVQMAGKASTHRQEAESDSPPKNQVVGWPPVRSLRKTTVAANPNSPSEVDCVDSNADSQASFYVKVNMDGFPVGRKVDLGSYNSYEDLSHALIEMFQLPNNGEGGSQCPSRRNDPSNPFHFHNDFSLTYEDKEGDWMLVGDIPWRNFLSAVCRLLVMKNS